MELIKNRRTFAVRPFVHVRGMMKPRKRSRKEMVASCDEIGPDDGSDPRTFFQKMSRPKTNRKALQLCSQIALTLGSVLAWESNSLLLQSLTVESVLPAPDSSRVLVTLRPDAAEPANTAQLLAALEQSAGWLRVQVAAAIHRKRVPELVFRLTGKEAKS